MRFETIDAIQQLLADLPRPDTGARAEAADRQDQLTKPRGSLGRLEELAIWLAGWQGRGKPTLDDVHMLVFAGNHGVAQRGVSAFPADVTAQMVGNFEAGGAAINQLSRLAGAQLTVTAFDLVQPSADFTEGPSLDEAAFAEAVSRGYDAVPEGADCIAIGEMGIGNTTAAAAICYGLFGGEAAGWTGRGTGLDEAGVARKAEVVAQGAKANAALIAEPLGTLRAFGGYESAAMFGAALACRHRRIPLLVDGYVASAAVAPLGLLDPSGLDHAVFGHRSAEQAHDALLARLGKEPLLDLGMRLGEGSGAAVALLVLRAAVETHNGMATFAEAGVSGG